MTGGAADCSPFGSFLVVVLSVVHILLWAFVLLGFAFRSTAWVNLFVLIPLIYIVQAALPYHVLHGAKEAICPETWRSLNDSTQDALFLPGLLRKIRKFTEERCFQSPISPQGMLVFGALTSAYRLLMPEKETGRNR